MKEKINNILIDKVAKTNAIICLIFLVLYLYIGFCIPYYDDDWIAGGPYGWFITYSGCVNGRYVGNALLDLLAQSRIIKTIVMGTVSLLIPYEIAILGCKFNTVIFRYKFILFNMLLMLIDFQMWSEVYGWVSGFGLYAVMGLLLIYYIRLHNDLFEGESGKTEYKWYTYTGLFLFAVIMQLFLENIAIAFFLLGFVALFVSVRYKINIAKHVVLFIGNVIGLIFLFSNGMIKELFVTGASVDDRHMSVETSAPLLQKIIKMFNSFLGESWLSVWNRDFYFTMILMALLIVDIFLVKKSLKKIDVLALCFMVALSVNYIFNFVFIFMEAMKLGDNKVVLLMIAFSVICFILWIIVCKKIKMSFKFGLLDHLAVFLSFLLAVLGSHYLFLAGIMYLVFSVYIIYWSCKTIEKKYCKMLVFIILLMILHTAPLAAVTENSPRLIYHGIILVLMLISIMANYLLSKDVVVDNIQTKLSEKKNLRKAKVYLGVGLVLLILSIVIPVTYEYGLNIKREKIISELKESNGKELIIPRYAISFRLYDYADSFHLNNVYRFYRYYGIDDDVSLYLEDEEKYNGDGSIKDLPPY